MTLDVRELLRRLRAGETHRQIARELAVARKTVAKYHELARANGLLDGSLPSPAEIEQQLGSGVNEANLPGQPYKAAPFRPVIEDLRRRGVEMMAIYQRLSDDHGYAGSYSALRRYVRHLEPLTPTGFVRLEVGPGEEAQVDFGSAGEMVDPKTGEVRKAYIFVMTLSYSRHQYAVLVFDQKVATWLWCHRQAFEYFGGVPRKLTIDNLKAAIVKAVFTEPVAQRSYRECAEHYGFLISPCRPATPRHKGKVESGVRYAKRNFLAGREFRDITDANIQLLRWIEELAGQRIHGTTRERPWVRFREVEQAALLTLPATPHDLGVWKSVKLHPDCHVVVDGAYYSVSHRLIGRKLWARTNGREVHIFHDYERVASHAWGRPGTRRTLQEHYPPEKVAWLMATPQFCRRRAEEIGAAAAEFMERLLNDHPMDRLRGAQAVVRLATRYGPGRLERACQRALCFDEISSASLRRILEKGLETDPLPAAPRAAAVPLNFVFARPGSEIFPSRGGVDHGR